MQCSRCRSENEDAAKFCATCGSALYKATEPVVCHICSHANTPGANFCVACGAHLRRRTAAAQGAAGMAFATNTPEARAETGMPPPGVTHTAASAATAATAPRPNIPPERPTASSIPHPRPDIASAARQDNFESAALRPPRISGFELKAGLAVLVFFVGGGLYWWSSQNDSRLAELALTAGTPAAPSIRPVADNPPPRSAPPMPDSTQDTSYLAAGSTAPVTAPPTAAPAATATPAPPAANEPTPKAAKPSRHKSAKRRHVEPEIRQAETVVPEPEPQVVAQAAPPPVEKRRPNLREQVAACRRMSLFDGERCLWRICDGRWGKDGCPSYN